MSAPSWLFFVGEGTPNAVSSASVLPAASINASLASARSVRYFGVDLGVEVCGQRVGLVAQQHGRLVWLPSRLLAAERHRRALTPRALTGPSFDGNGRA